MPLQTFNFMQPVHTPDYSGLANVFQNYYKGMEAAQTPERLEQESRKREADIAYQLAHAEHYKGAGNLQGLARARADLYKLGEIYGFDSPTYKNAERDFELQQQVQGSLVNQRQQIFEYRNLNSLPSDQKEKIFGQYAALGADARTGTELWNQGITPELIYAHKQHFPNASIGEITNFIKAGMGQIGSSNNQPQGNEPQTTLQPPTNEPQNPAQDLGGKLFEKVNPNPQLAPPADTRQVPQQPALTSSDRSAINVTKGALAEEAYIAPKITEAMAGYSEKVMGYSTKQFYDTFKSDPHVVDKMARFYAARALQPEIAGNRARLANSSTAHQAVEDIKRDSLNAIKIMDWRVSPEAYTKAQHYISEWIQGMANARIQGMTGMGDVGSNQQASRFGGGTVVRYLDGKKLNIPANLVEQFDKDHPNG